MKKSEIVVGKTYSNDKGTSKYVVAEGPQYTLLRNQGDLDCIRYYFRHKNGKVTPQCGEKFQFNTTRESFAKWAKAELGK